MINIIYTISDEGEVPYFKWFATKLQYEKNYKFTFIVLSTKPTKMIEFVSDLGFDTHWIKFDTKKRKLGLIKAFFRLIVLFIRIRPDIVHSHLFDSSVPSLLAAKLLGIKTRIITKQATTFHYNYFPKWVFIDKINNKLATDLIPVSNEAKHFVIEQENADPRKITMIHHGIPVDLFTNSSDEKKEYLINKHNLANKIVIGTVSRLIEWKGYRYIIQASKEIIQKYPNAVFVFVGEGPQMDEIKKIATIDNVIDNIVFTGWMDRKYIPSFYSLINVYLHAASFEPFGFVIPEAMMNGAPVVSTPTGAALDAIVHKQNGFLCKYKDKDSIVEGVLFAIKYGCEIKEKGRKTALKMYNFDRMYSDYMNFYINKVK